MPLCASWVSSVRKAFAAGNQTAVLAGPARAWPQIRPRQAARMSPSLAGLLAGLVGGCASDDDASDADADAPSPDTAAAASNPEPTASPQPSGSTSAAGASRALENDASWSGPSFVAFRQSLTDQTLREGETFALDIRPYFAGRGVVNYTFSNLPEGLVFSPDQMQLTGVVTDDAELGVRLVTVTALADTSAVTQSFTLDIQNENEAPETSGSQTLVQSWSAPFSLDLDGGPGALFSDPDPGDFLVYDLTGVSFLEVAPGTTSGSILVGMASGVGEHVATLVARDSSGLTAVSHLTLTLTENHAPSAIGPLDTTLFVTESVPAALELSTYFADPDAGDRLAFTASGLPAGLSVSDDGWVRGEIPEPTAEVYSVTVTALDGGELFARYAFELHARRINDPPTRVGEASLHWTLTEGAGVSLALTELVADPDAHDFLVYRFSGLPAGLTLETSDGAAWVEGVSPFAPESQTHTLTASDRAGASVETTVTFFFEEKVTAPHRVAGSPETWTVAEGELVALTLGDFYTGSGALSFRFGSHLDRFTPLDSLGSGSLLAAGVLRGHFIDDKASARVQTLEIVVSSDQATVTESLFFAVTEVNQPPQVLRTIPDKTFAENATVTVDLARVFTDPDEDHARSLTLSVSGVPEGLVFEPRLQRLSGAVTDDALVEQPLEVQLTATETAGLSVSVSFTLYVTNVNDPVSQTRDFEPVQSLGTAAAAGVVLDLADYVADPDPGEVLSYAASVSGASVVSLDLSGSQLGLRVAPLSPYHFGEAEVSVTIQDRAGSSVSDSFVFRHTHLTLSDDLFSDGMFGSVYEGATLWEVGDIDGDGFSDAGGFTSGSGLALFFGGPDGVSRGVSISSDSSVSDFTFGPAGDVNGDGLADVWLTEGRDEVYVLFGSPSLRSLSSLDLETLSPEAGFVLGVSGMLFDSVRGGLDFNQDGWSDLLVYDAHGFWMVYGGLRPLGQEASVSGPESPEAPSIFRQFLSVDRPGPDGNLHLNAPDSWKLGEFPYRPGGSLLPLVFGVREYVFDLTAIRTIYSFITHKALSDSAETSSAFGLLGDLDGDGHGELAAELSALAGGESRVGVYYGAASSAFETGFEIVSSEPGFGKSLTGVDLNGDGLDELVVASSETVYVLYGRAAQRTGTVVLSDLSPEVGFALVPQSGLVEGVSAAGDVNGDGFEDLWVRVAPPPVDASEPAAPAEPAESILVYGNASWGAADRVPVPTPGSTTLGTAVSPYGGSGADSFTLSVEELLADPELFRHGGLGSDSLTLTRGEAAAGGLGPSVDLSDMTLTQRLLSFETLVLDGVDLTLSAEAVYELSEARRGGLATLELGGRGSVRLSDASPWTQDLAADPGGDVWSQGRARVRVASDDLSVSSWTPEPIRTLTLGSNLEPDRGVPLSLPVARAGAWVSRVGGDGSPDFVFEAQGQGGVPELRVLRDFAPDTTETVRYRLEEGRVTLQDGRVVVPGQLFDTDATLRDRQPIAVEPDGTIAPRYTELGRIEPLYQIVYADEDIMDAYGTPWHETFLGTVLSGDSLEYKVWNDGMYYQQEAPPPEGSSWVDNTLVAQDGSKLAVREQLYHVRSIVAGEHDAFSLLRFAGAGQTLAPGDVVMTYDGVTVTDTLVVNQVGEELARLAFHTLIEFGTITLTDGMTLESSDGTTLTPELLADLASSQTLGELTDDGRTPVWTYGAEGQGNQAALLVTQTLVESGEFAYYDENPSGGLHLSYWPSHLISYFPFRQGQPTFDGSFLTFTDAGQIVDEDGVLLGTGRPLETVTGLPDWAGNRGNFVRVTHYDGAAFEPNSPNNYLLSHPTALSYKTSDPDFASGSYHGSIRASGDTVGSYDTSSGRVVEETLYTEATPPETVTALTLEVLETPDGEVSQPFAPVGDVNGDGLADVLLGGTTSALLYGKEDFGRDTAFRPHLPRGQDLVLENGAPLPHGERLGYDIDLPGDATLAGLQQQEEGPYGFALTVGMEGDAVTVSRSSAYVIVNLANRASSSNRQGIPEELVLQLGDRFDASWLPEDPDDSDDWTPLTDGYGLRESGDGAEATIFREGGADPVAMLQRVYRLVDYGTEEPLLYTTEGRPLYHGSYFSGASEGLPSGYEILETDDYLIVGRTLADGRVVQSVSLTEAWIVTDLDMNPNPAITLEKTPRLEVGQTWKFPLTLSEVWNPHIHINVLDFYPNGDLLQVWDNGNLVRLRAFTYDPRPGQYGMIEYNGFFYNHTIGYTLIGDTRPLRVVESGAVELEDGRLLLPGHVIREDDTLANGQAAMFEDGVLANQTSTEVEVFVPLNRTEEELSVPHLSPQAGYRVINTPHTPPPDGGDDDTDEDETDDTAEPEATGFGQIVAGLGDVNGDLVDDVAILTLPPDSADTATVFGVAGERGNDRVLLDLAEAPEDSFFQLDLAGLPEGQSPAVQAAGDVDSDGYGDFLVTAPAADTGAGTGARVWLFYGNRTLFESLTAEDAELLVFGPESVGLGEQPLLGSAGDFNGDGYDDVFVRLTDPSATDSPTRLAVLFGSDEGLGDLAAVVAGGATLMPDTLPAGRGFFITHASGEAVSFASDAASVGDVNGDGLSDLVVASSGQNWLLYGSETPAASVEVTQLRAGQGLVVSGLEAPSGDARSAAARRPKARHDQALAGS